MASPKTKNAPPVAAANDPLPTGVEVIKRSRANEFFIAIVASAGAGAGTAANVIRDFLARAKVDDQPIEVSIIKASQAIRSWAVDRGLAVPDGAAGRKTLADMIVMQDRGDDMRRQTGDNAAVARASIRMIRERRAELSKKEEGVIDGKPRAYIIDSLRHPDEVHLLRSVYQDAFLLVGVVADPDSRDRRLRQLFDIKVRTKLETTKAIEDFVLRDADADVPFGQHVTAAFHESDFFVDNSKDAQKDDLKNTEMNEPIRRFVDLITGSRILRPKIEETAMHHAHSAKLRSACMSRQVGAAVVDVGGNIVATGTNEVPMAGGGVYGKAESNAAVHDHRCVFRETKFCSSNREQNEIIDELVDTFPTLLQDQGRAAVVQKIRETKLGGLIEFSRAVHAEMDALLTAARIGVSAIGARLFVTTFPCHYCARHIVSAGVDEVQYIEPYPKSRALTLHSDSITTTDKDWKPPSLATGPSSKVLFRPFVGVAPRMYQAAFLKDRGYKDNVTGEFKMSPPRWGASTELSSVHYTDLEAKLGILTP